MDFKKLLEIGDIDRRLLNYHTEFTSEGTIEKKESITACFAPVLKTGYDVMDNTYNIKMLKAPLPSKDNFLYFSIEEIEKYMKYIKEIYDNFEWEIKDENEALFLTIKINDKHFYHTLVLTFIRYLYEFNYAIMLNEAMRLKETFRFRNLNILSLMSLVRDCWPKIRNSTSSDMSHFYSGYCDILSNKEVKDRIEILSSDYKYITREHCWLGDRKKYKYFLMRGIVEIFPAISEDDMTIRTNIRDYDDVLTKECIENLESGFIERYKIYRKYYKIIRDHFSKCTTKVYDSLKKESPYYFDYMVKTEDER